MKKRPLIITIFAILVLLSVPGDLFKAITLNEKQYQEDIENVESLIRNGVIKYRGRTIYWKDKDDFQKKMVINKLDIQKKILSKSFLYRIFKSVFVILNLFLFYALWKMKKWTFIILIISTIAVILFNIIFMFLTNTHFLLLLVPYIILLILVCLGYRKHFVY